MKRMAVLLGATVALLVVSGCGGGDGDGGSDAGAADATSVPDAGSSAGAADATSVPDAGPPAGVNPWDADLCTLLSDDEVAAVFDGNPPTESTSSADGSVAADGYGGSSCRWKVSASQFLGLDVYPSADGRLDEMAAYDPWDRWAVEPFSGIGDDARLIVWDGIPELEAPGSVLGLVVEQGEVGMRLDLTAQLPAEPDELVAAAQLVLDRL